MMMNQLNDDVIKSIGQYTGILYGPKSYVYFASTCKRMRKLLLLSPADDSTSEDNDDGGQSQTIKTSQSQNKIVSKIIQARTLYHLKDCLATLASTTQNDKQQPLFWPNDVKTLQQLAVFEKWILETNFMHDNRITFPFASTEIADDMQDRITQIVNIMRRYPNVRVRLDAHCGNVAPSDRIALRFSRERGMSIVRAIGVGDGTIDRHTCMDMVDRFDLYRWGKMITDVVAKSPTQQHPFQKDARRGLGWVEVYFMVGDDDDKMVIPKRHAYYDRSIVFRPHVMNSSNHFGSEEDSSSSEESESSYSESEYDLAAWYDDEE